MATVEETPFPRALSGALDGALAPETREEEKYVSVVELVQQPRMQVLIGAILVYLAFGTELAFENLVPYVLSYVRYNSPAEENSGVGYEDADWAWSSGYMVKSMLFLGGVLELAAGPTTALLIGGSVFCIGVGATYFSISTFTGFIMTYCVTCGLGQALAYVVPLTVVVRWFEGQSTGTAVGIIYAAYGLSSAIFSPIHSEIINPHGVASKRPPGWQEGDDISERYFLDPKVLDRIPLLFPIMAVIYFSLIVCGTSLLKNPVTTARGGPQPDRVTAILTAVCTPHFWLLWLMFLANVRLLDFIQGYSKLFGMSLNIPDMYLADAFAVAAICTATGRLTFGMLADQVGFQRAMMGLVLAAGLLTGTWPLVSGWGQGFFLIWMWALHLVVAGNFSLMSFAVVKTFGAAQFGPLYGLIYTAQIPGTLLGAELALTVATARGEWTLCYLSTGWSVVGLALISMWREPFGKGEKTLDGP